VVAPLAPERYKVQITIGQETHDKLRRVQDLLRRVTAQGGFDYPSWTPHPADRNLAPA
jgi:hypothetical protein